MTGTPLFAPPLAYMGPASGVMAVIVLLGVVAAIAVALLGFVWFPLKRLWRKHRGADDSTQPPES